MKSNLSPESSQKIIRAGHSLAVTIPAHFVKQIGLQAGNQSLVELRPETNQLIITFPDASQLPLIS